MDKEEVPFEKRKRLDGELELSDEELELIEEEDPKDDISPNKIFEKTEIGGGILKDLEDESLKRPDQNEVAKQWYNQDLFK